MESNSTVLTLVRVYCNMCCVKSYCSWIQWAGKYASAEPVPWREAQVISRVLMFVRGQWRR